MQLVNKHARRSLLFLLGAAVLAGGASAATTGPTSEAAGRAHKQTIELREASPKPALTVVDIGAPGLSIGDHVLTTDAIVHTDGTPAGSMSQVCTVVELGAGLLASTFDCSGSFQLEHGEITVQGSYVPADAVTSFAVTGGTNAFATARGQATIATEADEITIALA